MPLRWGILSTANITDKLLDSGTDQEFVAVGSRDGARAEAYAREKGIARAHGSYEALLADPDVDAIYNPLPNSMHVEWSIRALEAGKHVLCEKPLTRHPEDVDRVFDVAEREGRVLAEAFMWRHHPQVARTRELLDSGAVGDLRVIRSAFAYLQGDPDDIRLHASLEGGGLMDVGCYCVSGCRTLADAEPELASADYVPGGQAASTSRSSPRCASPATCWPTSTVACPTAAAATSRPSAPTARSCSRIPGTRPTRSSRSAAVTARSSASTPAPPTPTRSSWPTSRPPSAASRQPLLGRDDALGQARTIAALYTSAERNAPCPIG